MGLKGDSVDTGRNVRYDTTLTEMLKRTRYYTLFVCIIALIGVAARAADTSPTLRLPPNQAQVKELRGLGLLVGRGEAWDKVEREWRSFVEKAKEINLDAAVDHVTREASQEATRNAELSKKRLDQLTVLKGAVIEELGRTRVILADAQKRKTRTMINRNEFEVTQSEPFKVVVKPRGTLSFEAEVAQYVRELEANLRSIDGDVRRANAELATMTRIRQDVTKNLPEIRDKLMEIGMKVQEGTL